VNDHVKTKAGTWFRAKSVVDVRVLYINWFQSFIIKIHRNANNALFFSLIFSSREFLCGQKRKKKKETST
jgi:hypothetical protein